MIKKNFILALCFLIAGCGYTTSGCLYKEGKIIIAPVVNKVNITSESRKYSAYTTFPLLIENKLVNELVSKFNIDGNLKVVSEDASALNLKCVINDYAKESLRYEADDDVEEQRLRLYVSVTLTEPGGKVLKSREVVGETTYFLTGTNQKSEAAAQVDLVNDTARRVVEAVVEEW